MFRLLRHSLSVVRTLLVLAAFLLATASCGGGPAAPAAPSPGTPDAHLGQPYKIGFLAAITGSSSLLGVPERDAAVMLQQQFDAQGGIVGPDGVRHPSRS